MLFSMEEMLSPISPPSATGLTPSSAMGRSGSCSSRTLEDSHLLPSLVYLDRVQWPHLLGAILGRLLIRSPREMSTMEIKNVVKSFACSARLAEEAGFAGIQVHAAHGYLLSQFLSPLANHRIDEYGGNAKNRWRLLLETIAAVRASTSPSFVVGVKVSSRDVRSSSEDEMINLLEELCSGTYGLDFIEISGGSMEDAVFVHNVDVDPKGGGEEGFFLNFAKRLRQVRASKTSANRGSAFAEPAIIVTGGFRSRTGMNSALRSGAADLIGLARPLVMQPSFSEELLLGRVQHATSTHLSVGLADSLLVPTLNSLWYQQQMQRLSGERDADPNLGVVWTLTGRFGRSYIWDPAWRSLQSTSMMVSLALIMACMGILNVA